VRIKSIINKLNIILGLHALRNLGTIVILNKVKNLIHMRLCISRDPSLKLRMTKNRYYKGVGVFISLLLVISSCSIKGYKPITESEKNKIIAPHIFADKFEKVLYKTNLDIYGNEITGLTLIKKTDSAIRVVSMSELGIKYFDIEFPSDRLKPVKVHYIMELLNKKLLVNMIKRDFSLLLLSPEITKSDIKVSDENDSKMLVKHNKLIYFFDSSGAIFEIAKQRSLKPVYRLSGYQQYFPDTIIIDHGKITFEFESIEQ